MSTQESNEASQTLSVEAVEERHIAEHPSSLLNGKSAQKVHKHSTGAAKTDTRYWQQSGKLVKMADSPNYSMQIQFKGRRMRFTTSTGNKEAAARIAAGIYNDLITLGVEGALAKHRPQTAKPDTVATVGEWIDAAKLVSEANESTFTCYARALRLIAGGIMEVRKSKKRFGPKKGGSTKYRETIDAISLDAFTPTDLQKWRLAYVKKAKNPAQERSSMTSCNSTIRQARSLFAPKVVKFLHEMKLPEPPPFAGVEFFPRQSARYISKIDPRTILQKAQMEIAPKQPAVFLALLLSLGAGLRRSEIDSLCWHQVDTVKKVIRVEITEVANLKTNDSRGEVEIDDDLASILQGYKAKAKEKGYVIEAEGTGGPRKWGQHYRADVVFNELIAWLRGQGVTARKPIHELRKELGALITQEHGIYAASRALRHSNVATTAAHYADKKARTTVDIGGMLNPENVIPLPEQSTKTAAIR